MGKHIKAKEESENESKKRKKKHTGLKIFIFILIVLAIAGGILGKRVYDLDGNWLAVLFGHDKRTLENLDKLYVLVMGESGGMSDTIMVCSYDPKTQEAAILSIPRDTFIGSSRERATTSDKINALYNNGRDPMKTMEAVNEITGLNIQYYVLVDTQGLIELVNLIGGIEFDVPIDMKYNDNNQNLHIDLKAGLQTLTGEQVEQLVRFRHNKNGSTYSYSYGIEDFGRMRTQREVIIAIAKQTIQLKNVKEIKNMLDILDKYVKTNLDISSLKDYIPYAIKLDTDTIRAEQLPGASEYINGISFFLYNEEKAEELIDEMFNGVTVQE